MCAHLGIVICANGGEQTLVAGVEVPLVAAAGGGWGGVAGRPCAGAVLGAAAGCGPPSSPGGHVLCSDCCLRRMG